MIRDFLSAAGLIQAVRGFDADMVIMNPGFESEIVPGALDDLRHVRSGARGRVAPGGAAGGDRGGEPARLRDVLHAGMKVAQFRN